MLDYAVFCFWFFLGCVFGIGWYARQALYNIKAEWECKEQAERNREDRVKREDAQRRWDASMEATKELWM